MNTVHRVLRILSSTLVALVLLLAFLLVGIRLFGLQIYSILSPSMEPDYPTGSIIYVKAVDPADLDVRDVITFRLNNNVTATHRIIELVPDTSDPSVMLFRTKGDSNDIPDGTLVHPDNVLGTPVFALPYLGYLATYIQNPRGSIVAITVAICLLFFIIIVDLVADDKTKRPNGRKNKPQKGGAPT